MQSMRLPADCCPSKRILVALVGILVTGSVGAIESRPPPRSSTPIGPDPISVRTETYPRPPYSGATYYLYERAGTVICTKLEVCNKFDVCEATYFKGQHRAEEDVRTGEPYGRTEAVPIARGRLGRHQCLARFHPD